MPNWADWQAIPSDVMDQADNLQKASDWGQQQMQKVADMWGQKWNSFPLPQAPAQTGGAADQTQAPSAPATQSATDWGSGVQASPALAPAPAASPDLTAPDRTSAQPGTPSPQDVEDYIRQSAKAHGISPDVAVAVANSEGGTNYGSDAWLKGDNGSSYGPFQLHRGNIAGGGNAVGGLGDDFAKQTGLDPSDPSSWKQQVDYALNAASSVGWGPWHGAARVGIGNKQGIGLPVDTSQASGTSDPSQATALPGTNPDGKVVATEDQRTFEKEAGLSDADAYSACGPVAAAAFAKTYGRNPTPQEAIDLAKQVGWTGGQGMAGVHSEQDLLQKLGVNTKLEEGQQFNWGDVQRDAMNGNPVIIDTPGHYFYISNFDPQSSKYYVGNSGLVFKNGTDWMTSDEISARGGGARAALFADHPTAEGPSITEQNPDQPDQKPTDQNPLSQAVAGFHDIASATVQKVQDAVSQVGQNLQNPDQSALSNPTSAALGLVGGMANSATQAAQQVSQPVTNQELTDVNAPGNQAARQVSMMLGAGDMGAGPEAASNVVKAAPGTPDVPETGVHPATGWKGLPLNPTDTSAPPPTAPSPPVSPDISPDAAARARANAVLFNKGPSVAEATGAPPPAPPTSAPPVDNAASAAAAAPVKAAAQRGINDFYASNPPGAPPPPAPPAGATSPPPEPQPAGSTVPDGARGTISQGAYDAAVTRIENAISDPDAAAAAHQQLDQMITQGADPGAIARFLGNDVEGRSVGPLDVTRTLRTGSMAGGVSSLGKVGANIIVQPILRGPTAAMDMALSGRAGDIPTAMGGAMQGLADGARLALQTLKYGTNDEAALRGGSQGAYGYPAGLDVMGTNPVTRAAGAGLSGLVRLHGAAADLTSGIGRGAATALGASPDEAAQTGAQWALRSGNYGFWGGKAANVLDQVRGNQQGGIGGVAGNLAAQIIMPFFRVAYNATTQGVELSPLGAAGTAFDVGRAPFGSGPYAAGGNANGAVTDLSRRAINNAFGVGLAGAAFELAANGNLTGASPQGGKQPWSLYVNGAPVPLRSIPIAGESLAQAADLYEAFRDGRGDVKQTATKVAQGYASHVADDTWLTSIADLFSEGKDVGTLLNPKANKSDVKSAQRDIGYQGQNLVNSFIPQDRLATQAANSQNLTIPNEYIGKAQKGMQPITSAFSGPTSGGSDWQAQLANLKASPRYKMSSPAQQQAMVAQAQADFSKESSSP